jgi:hypothetical protein
MTNKVQKCLLDYHVSDFSPFDYHYIVINKAI